MTDFRMNIASDRPLRIAALEPSGRLYGSEYCLLDIVRGVNCERFNWSVITPAGKGFAELLQWQNVSCCTALPGDLHHRGRFGRARAYARLLLAVRKLRPDLLYVNQAGMLRAGSLICKVLGIPGVCQVQTLEDADWISRSHAGHGQMLAYICNSDFIASRTAVPADRRCVLYQGIGATPAYAQMPPENTEPLSLGLIGRISESKGHYLALEAAALLRAKGMRVRIRVIGDGVTAEDTARFSAAVTAAGLQDTFDLRGYCRDLRAEFSSIQLLLIPSIAEPLGRVLYDAAHFGVPVIAADSGGLGEICRLYGVGESFPAGRADALAAAIQRCAGQLESVTRAFRSNSAAMVQSLDMKSYLDVIEGILMQASKGVPCAVRWRGDAVLER
jgi:glycosyltransferase involved in cell wall biosynthesis